MTRPTEPLAVDIAARARVLVIRAVATGVRPGRLDLVRDGDRPTIRGTPSRDDVPRSTSTRPSGEPNVKPLVRSSRTPMAATTGGAGARARR